MREYINMYVSAENKQISFDKKTKFNSIHSSMITEIQILFEYHYIF